MVLVDIDSPALDRLVQRLGPLAIPVVTDLTSADSVAAAVARIRAELGTVDILINNAGILSNNKMDSTNIAEWRRVQAINVEAALM